MTVGSALTRPPWTEQGELRRGGVEPGAFQASLEQLFAHCLERARLGQFGDAKSRSPPSGAAWELIGGARVLQMEARIAGAPEPPLMGPPPALPPSPPEEEDRPPDAPRPELPAQAAAGGAPGEPAEEPRPAAAEGVVRADRC